jgi:hypothetical protein
MWKEDMLKRQLERFFKAFIHLMFNRIVSMKILAKYSVVIEAIPASD